MGVMCMLSLTVSKFGRQRWAFVAMRVRAPLSAILAVALGALVLAPGAQAKSGDLVVAQLTPPALVGVNPQTGHADTLATGPSGVSRACYLAFEPNGRIAVTDENGKIWIANSSTGAAHVLAVSGAAIESPYGIAADGKGNLIVADYGKNRVVRVSKTGDVSVLSPRHHHWLGFVQGVAVDPHTGTIYVLDTGGAVDRLSPSGHLSTLASGSPFSNGLWTITRGPDGTLYVTDASKHQLDRVNPKNGAVHKVASLPGSQPYGVAAASNKIVYTTDINAGTVSRINVKTGHVAPVATGLTEPIGIAVQP
jgi:streptogramin lyase